MSFDYSGKDELLALESMTSYNTHIACLFDRFLDKGRLLDFGAGRGTITELMRVQGHHDITCVEADMEQRTLLQQKGFTTLGTLEECKTEEFDGAFSSNVLEHIADEASVLRSLYRALRSGGRAVFWVPAFECLWTELDNRVAHQRRYTRQSLQKAFTTAGFVVERCFYQDSIGFFVALLVKVMEKLHIGGNPLNRRTVLVYDRIIFPLSRLGDILLSSFFGKNVVIVVRKP